MSDRWLTGSCLIRCDYYIYCGQIEKWLIKVGDPRYDTNVGVRFETIFKPVHFKN